MYKNIIFSIIIISSIIITGCVDNNSDFDFKEKIVGKWLSEAVPQDEGSVIFNFLTNNTLYINFTEINNGSYSNQTTTFKYNVTKDNLKLFIADEPLILDYSFKDNFATLSLIDENGTPTILTKIY
jgi:hypothetical protein